MLLTYYCNFSTILYYLILLLIPWPIAKMQCLASPYPVYVPNPKHPVPNQLWEKASTTRPVWACPTIRDMSWYIPLNSAIIQYIMIGKINMILHENLDTHHQRSYLFSDVSISLSVGSTEKPPIRRFFSRSTAIFRLALPTAARGSAKRPPHPGEKSMKNPHGWYESPKSQTCELKINENHL